MKNIRKRKIKLTNSANIMKWHGGSISGINMVRMWIEVCVWMSNRVSVIWFVKKNQKGLLAYIRRGRNIIGGKVSRGKGGMIKISRLFKNKGLNINRRYYLRYRYYWLSYKHSRGDWSTHSWSATTTRPLWRCASSFVTFITFALCCGQSFSQWPLLW